MSHSFVLFWFFSLDFAWGMMNADGQVKQTDLFILSMVVILTSVR